MFPMTMTINNADELNKVLAAMQGAAVAQAVKETPKEVAAKPEVKKQEAKPAEEVADTASPAATEPSTTEATTTASADAKTYTVDDAKSLTMKIVADKGRDAAVALLKSYGVPVAAKLAADQIDAFCADAEAVLA